MNQCTSRWKVAWVMIVPLYAGLLPAFASWQDAPSKTTEELAREAEQARRQREEVAERMRRIVMQFTERARETKTLVENLARSEKQFSERLRALMTNDDGKRFGHDRSAFFDFARLIEQPIVSAEEIRGRESAIKSLVDGLELELKRDAVGFAPKEETLREVDETLYWSRERLATLNSKKAWIDSVIAAAPKDLDLAKEPTLEVRLREDAAAREKSFAEARLAGEERGRKEGAAAVAEAARTAELQRALAERDRVLNELRAEVERMRIDAEMRAVEQARKQMEAEQQVKEALAEVERQKLLAEAERRARDKEAELGAKSIDDATRKKELQAKCQDPTVRTALAPFISDGYWQPSGRRGIDKMSMSWKALNDSGALGTDERALHKLWWVGSNRDNDRPHFSMAAPGNAPGGLMLKRLTPEQMEELKKARDLLRELGPTLVELKLLQP